LIDWPLRRHGASSHSRRDCRSHCLPCDGSLQFHPGRETRRGWRQNRDLMVVQRRPVANSVKWLWNACSNSSRSLHCGNKAAVWAAWVSKSDCCRCETPSLASTGWPPAECDWSKSPRLAPFRNLVARLLIAWRSASLIALFSFLTTHLSFPIAFHMSPALILFIFFPIAFHMSPALILFIFFRAPNGTPNCSCPSLQRAVVQSIAVSRLPLRRSVMPLRTYAYPRLWRMA
jgi:hypothetical protein